MNLKKLFLTGMVVLCASPFAFADEIGGGYPSGTATTTSSDEIGGGTPTTQDEIGGGTPSTQDEIGGGMPASGDSIETWLLWWSTMLRSI